MGSSDFHKVNFKDWKSFNRFFFNGRLMTGSKTDNPTMIFCYSYIIAITVVYYYILSPFITKEFGPLSATLGYFFFAVCFFFQLRTTFSDPGAIPRGNIQSGEEALESGILLQREEEASSGASSTLDTSNDKGISMISAKGTSQEITLYRYRHCSTCKIMRPPKSSHCNDCGNCVKDFDHHCFFVGNCIGRRNHLYFFYFLLFGMLYSVYMTLVCIYGFYQQVARNGGFKEKLGNQFEYWLLAICFIVFPPLLCRSRAAEGCRNSLMSLGFLIMLIGLVVVSWGVDLPYEEAPITFLFIAIVLSPITIWVVGAFLGTIQVIVLDYTTKEKAVLEREVLNPGRKKELFTATKKEKIRNLMNFFLRPVVESHISV